MSLNFLNERCSIYSIAKVGTGRYQSKPVYTLNSSAHCRIFSRRDVNYKMTNDKVTTDKLFIGKTTIQLKPTTSIGVGWRIVDSNLLKYTVEEVKPVSDGKGGVHVIHAICKIIK